MHKKAGAHTFLYRNAKEKRRLSYFGDFQRRNVQSNQMFCTNPGVEINLQISFLFLLTYLVRSSVKTTFENSLIPDQNALKKNVNNCQIYFISRVTY